MTLRYSYSSQTLENITAQHYWAAMALPLVVSVSRCRSNIAATFWPLEIYGNNCNCPIYWQHGSCSHYIRTVTHTQIHTSISIQLCQRQTFCIHHLVAYHKLSMMNVPMCICVCVGNLVYFCYYCCCFLFLMALGVIIIAYANKNNGVYDIVS